MLEIMFMSIKSKQEFFNIIEQRLRRYARAIPMNGDAGMLMHISNCISINVMKLKGIDSSIDLFGKEFWGYGINSISDGKETFSQPDVEEVMKISELNKHIKDYRLFWLLTFKVQENFLFVSVFCIDSCSAIVNSNTHTKFDLKNFSDARIRTREERVFVDIYFKGIEKPIYFQIDPNNNPIHTAKSYIDALKDLASKVCLPDNENLLFTNKLNDKISEIELQIREKVANTLIRHLGTDDFEKILTGEPKQQVHKRIKDYIEKHPGCTIQDFQSLKKSIQFTDLDHLKKLIIKKEYWEYFKETFKNVESTNKYFDQLAELRHVIRHNREMSSIILLEGQAALAWFKLALKP